MRVGADVYPDGMGCARKEVVSFHLIALPFKFLEQSFPLRREFAEVGFQNDMCGNSGVGNAVQPREFLFKVEDGPYGRHVFFQIGVCPL